MHAYRLQKWRSDKLIENWLKDTTDEENSYSVWYTEKFGAVWIDPKPVFDHNYRMNLDLSTRFNSIVKLINKIGN